MRVGRRTGGWKHLLGPFASWVLLGSAWVQPSLADASKGHDVGMLLAQIAPDQQNRDSCLDPLAKCVESGGSASAAAPGGPVGWTGARGMRLELGGGLGILAPLVNAERPSFGGELSLALGIGHHFQSSDGFVSAFGRGLLGDTIGASFGVRGQLPTRLLVGLAPTSTVEVSETLRVTSLLGSIVPEVGLLFLGEVPALYTRTSVGADWLVSRSWMLRGRLFVMANYAPALDLRMGLTFEVAYCAGCGR